LVNDPSRGIAIIQTRMESTMSTGKAASFNPSRGIAIIQTESVCPAKQKRFAFQSLTRDSNHSNTVWATRSTATSRFNPSRGIAIIQTTKPWLNHCWLRVSIPHAG